MEFPIKIILTIVIAMVVSLSLLQISRNILSDSETKIGTISKNDAELINIDDSLSAEDIAYIAEECNKMGLDNPKIEQCFIVMATSTTCTPADITTKWNDLGHSEPLNIKGNGNTLYFYYQNPGVSIVCN